MGASALGSPAAGLSVPPQTCIAVRFSMGKSAGSRSSGTGAISPLGTRALQTITGDTVVFVRTEQGFEARKISVGRQDARLVEVTSGLTAGERIATSNTFVLKAELGKAEAGHDA